jgi:hypothetical protein
MLAAAGVGIFAAQVERRELVVCIVIAAGLPLIYFLRPWYMT